MPVLRKAYNKLNDQLVDRYGLGLILRRYGFYPKNFPITITGEHGPSLLDEPIKQAMEKISPFYFVTARYKDSWSIRDKIIIRHPSQFAWYRRKNGIERDKNAKGSLFFYSHSTKLVKSITDKELFFSNLKSIPKEFEPITICLHFNDIENEFINKITENGYKWLTLSKDYNDNQIQNFYEHVPKFQFVLANSFTSGLLYACELGIPVSIVFHENTKFINKGNKQYDLAEWSYGSNKNTRSTYALDLFKGYNTRVTEAQEKFTYEILGLDLVDSLRNRLKVMACFYISLFYVAFKTLIRERKLIS